MQWDKADECLWSIERAFIDPVLGIGAKMRGDQLETLVRSDLAFDTGCRVEPHVGPTMRSEDQERHSIVVSDVSDLHRFVIAREPDRLTLTAIPHHRL